MFGKWLREGEKGMGTNYLYSTSKDTPKAISRFQIQHKDESLSAPFSSLLEDQCASGSSQITNKE
jgi:hypothetical protein